MMLQALSSDGVVRKAATGGAVNRVELSLAPAAPTELRGRAVAPILVIQRDPARPSPLAIPAQAMGRIKNEFDKIAMAESDRKALDEILGKLLPGYKALLDRIESPGAVSEAEKAVEAFRALRAKLSGSSSAQDPDPSSGGNADSAMARIEDALRNIDALRGRLVEEHADAHDRLLAIAAPSGKPPADASKAGENGDVTRSTAAARDLVLANLRKLGAAHGLVSPAMARLVLS
jgi:hypothetical protein